MFGSVGVKQWGFVIVLMSNIVQTRGLPNVYSTYYMLSTSSTTSSTCAAACAGRNFVGVTGCSQVVMNSNFLNAVKSIFPAVTTMSTTDPNANGFPYVVGTTVYVPGSSNCGFSATAQICTCTYSGLNMSSLATYSSAITGVATSMTQAQTSGYSTASSPSPLYPNYAFDTFGHGFSSVAMDSSNNIYYTIATYVPLPAGYGGVSTYTPTGFLYVIYSPYTSQPVFTGINTCAYVFNNAVNVFCLGSDGLIQVV